MSTVLKAKLKELPRSPGVYFHKDASGNIIYIGKAAVLKNRVRQYFQSKRAFDNKTMALVNDIADVDWIEVESEVDALFLENEMVKRYMPKYNVLLRDDKSQMYVRINMKDEWPTVTFTRNPLDDGADYYGPFYNGFALKQAVRLLRRVFPYRTTPPRPGESSLNEEIGLSPKMSEGPEVYKANLRKLISYIKGNRKKLVSELEAEMKAAAARQEFELAAKYRNQIRHMKELQRRVMFGDKEHLQISKDKALADLTEILSLGKAPQRIEGYDISHMSGTNVVGSMVVFLNGVSSRADYRKFKTKIQANNDVGNMREVLSRRLAARNLASWGEPDLVIIDGGKGQLEAAVAVLGESQLKIPVIGIAKRDEEIMIHKEGSNIDLAYIEKLSFGEVPGVSAHESGNFWVVNLHIGAMKSSSHAKNLRQASVRSPYTDVVKLLQRIRDESHRFAVSYHTVLKRQGQSQGQLDEIPGVGPVTRKKLLKTFGSVKQIASASEEELRKVVSQKIVDSLKKYL